MHETQAQSTSVCEPLAAAAAVAHALAQACASQLAASVAAPAPAGLAVLAVTHGQQESLDWDPEEAGGPQRAGPHGAQTSR